MNLFTGIALAIIFLQNLCFANGSEIIEEGYFYQKKITSNCNVYPYPQQHYVPQQYSLSKPKPSSSKPKKLVKRSINKVARSRNYITKGPKTKGPKDVFKGDIDLHNIDLNDIDLNDIDLITRAPGQILNAPTGTTDVTTFTMETDVTITTTVEFIGETAINGNGNILYLGTGGSLKIDADSILSIKNITIKGINGQNIYCVDDTGTLVLKNVDWVQSGDFTFDQGVINVLNDFHCIGNGFNFIYSTDQACTIETGATMTIDYNFTFQYVPSNEANNLFVFADNSSALYLKGGTLYAGPGGLQLLGGLLFIDGGVSLSSDSSEISIGDGSNSDNDMACIFDTGAILGLTSGTLTYNNLLASSWSMRDINAILRIDPGTTIDVAQPLDLGPGTLLISTSATFIGSSNVTGNISFF